MNSSADPSWNIYGGIEGYLGANLGIFNRTFIEKEMVIFSLERLIAEGPKKNKPPVAILSVNPSSGNTSTVFNFDGSSSYDPDGDIDYYMMDFEGDGIYDVNYQISPNFSHTYSSSGNYYPTLKVIGDEGDSDTDTKSILCI